MDENTIDSIIRRTRERAGLQPLKDKPIKQFTYLSFETITYNFSANEVAELTSYFTHAYQMSLNPLSLASRGIWGKRMIGASLALFPNVAVSAYEITIDSRYTNFLIYDNSVAGRRSVFDTFQKWCEPIAVPSNLEVSVRIKADISKAVALVAGANQWELQSSLTIYYQDF